MRRLCEIDVSGLVGALHLLQWRSGGGEIFAMIDEWPAIMPVGPVFGAVGVHYPGRVRGMRKQ